MIFGYHLNIALIYLILLHSKMKGKRKQADFSCCYPSLSSMRRELRRWSLRLSIHRYFRGQFSSERDFLCFVRYDAWTTVEKKNKTWPLFFSAREVLSQELCKCWWILSLNNKFTSLHRSLETAKNIEKFFKQKPSFLFFFSFV